MIKISFNGRTASPRKVRVGVQGDNLVESVQFELPQLDESQVAVLYWQNGAAADAVTLNAGGMDIVRTMTQYSGKFTCFIEIMVNGSVLWHSELFYLTVYDLPDIAEQIDQLYPTAIEQGIETIQEIQNEMRQEMAAYAPDVQAAIERANSAADNANAAANYVRSIHFDVTDDMELEVTYVDNN